MQTQTDNGRDISQVDLAAKMAALTGTSSSLLETALGYERRGWPVFPCVAGGKVPATKDGFKSATMDEAQIRKWWIENPSYNIGIATGSASGVAVVDCDVKDGKQGIQEFLKLCEKNGIDPSSTYSVKTPSGGMHFYFKQVAGLGCSADKLEAGIDVRADGGYVVAAGSKTVKGHKSVKGSYVCDVKPIAEMPKFIPTILLAEKPKPAQAPMPSREFPDNKEEDIESALRVLSPDCSYQEWIEIGQALHAWDSSRGFYLWDSWSRQGSKYQEGATTKHWATFKSGGGLNVGTLFYRAKMGGWRPERKASSPLPHAVDNVDNPVLSKSTNTEYVEQIKQALYDAEIGDARLFSDIMKGKLLYNHTNQQWMTYRAGAWDRDETAQTLILLSKTLLKAYATLLEKTTREKMRLVADIAKTEDENIQKELGKKEQSLGKLEKSLLGRIYELKTKNYISKIETLSRSFLPVTTPEFELDKCLLCLANGTFDFKIMKLREHSPDDRLLNRSPVVYDPLAVCPKWDNFVDTIFCQNKEFISWIAYQCGVALTGLIPEESFLFWWGTGANGKSTFIAPLQWILGGYYLTLPVETLLVSRNDTGSSTAEYHRAGLFSKRLVVSPEMPEGRLLSEGLIKDLTGGVNDKISARNPYGKPFEFYPTHKLILYGNHKPGIRGVDDGIWRRVRMVPFNHCFKGRDRRDKEEVLAEYKQELSGIFNWMIDGYKLKPAAPSIVTTETTNLKNDSDILSDFMGEFLLKSDNCEIELSTIFKIYMFVCAASRELPVAKRSQDLARLFRERGITTKKGGGNKTTVAGYTLTQTAVKVLNSAEKSSKEQGLGLA